MARVQTSEAERVSSCSGGVHASSGERGARYLDGQVTECSEVDGALCDRCGEGVRKDALRYRSTSQRHR